MVKIEKEQQKKEQREIDLEMRKRLLDLGYDSTQLKRKVPVAFQHDGVDYYWDYVTTVEEHCHEQEAIDRLRARGITHIKRYCCEDGVNWYNRYVDANDTIILEEEC